MNRRSAGDAYNQNSTNKKKPHLDTHLQATHPVGDTRISDFFSRSRRGQMQCSCQGFKVCLLPPFQQRTPKKGSNSISSFHSNLHGMKQILTTACAVIRTFPYANEAAGRLGSGVVLYDGVQAEEGVDERVGRQTRHVEVPVLGLSSLRRGGATVSGKNHLHAAENVRSGVNAWSLAPQQQQSSQLAH